MPTRRLIDTNVIVRHLIGDNPAHAAAAATLFEACDRGDAILFVLPHVVAETVFVLESFYRYAREAIALRLTDLLSSPGVDVPDRDVHLEALKLYANTRLHFVDCMLAEHSRSSGLPIATFDAELRRLPGIKVEMG